MSNKHYLYCTLLDCTSVAKKTKKKQLGCMPNQKMPNHRLNILTPGQKQSLGSKMTVPTNKMSIRPITPQCKVPESLNLDYLHERQKSPVSIFKFFCAV